MLPSNHIRILDLLPAGSDGLKAPIKCVTRIVALSDEPVYEALSYWWGTDRGRRFITVGNELTSVTASLHAALFRLRHHSETRALWIDQLCINQEDTDEKSSQVRLMGHIYSHCTRCLVWLDELESGIKSDDAKGALEICAYLANRSLPIPACFQSPDAILGALKALSSIGPQKHPWWHRLWTVQETILPSSKKLLWGPLELDWEVLDRLANTKTALGERWASSGGELTGAGNTEIEINGVIDEYLNVLATNVLSVNGANKGDGPVSTILKWRRLQSTDPRDKVFGLLGLLPPDMPMPYTKKCNHKTPTSWLYRAFTLDVMLYTKSLEPLLIEPRTVAGQGTGSLPGWAIDMRCLPMFSVDPYYRIRGCGKGKYDACAGRKLDTAALLETAAVSEYHKRVLGLSGVMVDTVEVIGAGILLGSQTPALEKIAAVLRGWMEMARRFQEGLDGALDGDKFEEAFCRVLVGDSIRDSNQDVERRPTQEDLVAVSEFVKTGDGLINGLPFRPEYVGNQTFLITKGGMMGMGHRETEPGDEIWIFDGGAMPFAIRPKNGATTTDFDFVGCCYAHNIMNGEGYTDEIISASRRTVRLH
ncbi:hypothetical protein INS49_013400 [Diaporthe citri]|uniref:uncharacterized protein n=1 Tax=Diaporthe citri TaxID=83186 RepID=UPI001C80D4C9|nr:uncharacterized protein INS49_013400 [Diaporthe citri]KAG6357523.1 hypothetical protein INS49_013400 [Diaporthe citri]